MGMMEPLSRGREIGSAYRISVATSVGKDHMSSVVLVGVILLKLIFQE